MNLNEAEEYKRILKDRIRQVNKLYQIGSTEPLISIATGVKTLLDLEKHIENLKLQESIQKRSSGQNDVG